MRAIFSPGLKVAPQFNSRQPKHISPVSQQHIHPSVFPDRLQMSEIVLQIGPPITLYLTSDKDYLAHTPNPRSWNDGVLSFPPPFSSLISRRYWRGDHSLGRQSLAATHAPQPLLQKGCTLVKILQLKSRKSSLRVRSLRAVLLLCAIKFGPRWRLHLQVCCRKLPAARHEMRRQMISFLSHTRRFTAQWIMTGSILGDR